MLEIKPIGKITHISGDYFIEYEYKQDEINTKIDCHNVWKGERRNADRFFHLFHDQCGNTLMEPVMPKPQKPCFEFGNITHRNRS